MADVEIKTVAEAIATELTNITGKQVYIKDRADIQPHQIHGQAWYIQSPMTVNRGYPSYSAVRQNEFKRLYRIVVSDTIIAAVIWPKIPNWSNEEYEHYKSNDMIHRLYFKTTLQTPGCIESLIDFVTKEYTLSEIRYIDDESLTEEKDDLIDRADILNIHGYSIDDDGNELDDWNVSPEIDDDDPDWLLDDEDDDWNGEEDVDTDEDDEYDLDDDDEYDDEDEDEDEDEDY